MILYLHGLNSGSASGKAQMLRAALPDIEILAPTYPAHRPERAVAMLESLIAPLGGPRLMVVGSSMGGFYGRYLCQQVPAGHLVMINPALTPWDLLPRYAGTQRNLITGEAYPLTVIHIEQTRQFGVDPKGEGQTPVTLFLDQDDEVIDVRIAMDQYEGRGEIYLYQGGSHSFDHMPEAIRRIREIHEGLADKRRDPIPSGGRRS